METKIAPQENRMIVTLNEADLEKLIKKSVDEAIRGVPEIRTEKNLNEFFDGIKDMANYLRCSTVKAGRVLQTFPSDAYVRIGRKMRIYKWAVDQYMHGRLKP